ncbi:hypothetical protein [uncultured Mediterranean phage]|nr:hypothetical protein [uncultured Mediterranean phage]
MGAATRMKLFLTMLLFITTSCSLKSLITPAATIGGAAVGGAVGGPGGAALGSGVGYASGRIYELSGENEELVTALTSGDVTAIVEQGLQTHKSGFDEFTSTIKTILTVAACFLGLYLLVPIFVARQCSKSEAEKLTRTPFKPPTTGKRP